MKTFSDFGIEIPYGRTSGKIKMFCPNCHDKRTNKTDRSLSVDIDKGLWNCHYCHWCGTIHIGERSEKTPKKTYRRPTPLPLTTLSEAIKDFFAKRGISESTLFKMRIGECKHYFSQTQKEEAAIAFNYYIKDELINIKYRTIKDKMFGFESGAELVPYNLDGILEAKECIITEGEMDALSFIEIGYDNVVSVPNGANENLSYLDDFMRGWFYNKEIIYIASDDDSKGHILRDALIKRFGAERCRVLSYGDKYKDANELLVGDGKEALENALKMAKDVKVGGVFALPDYEAQLDDIFKNGLSKGFTIGHPSFDALCSFETKRLAVVTGIPGSGKSEWIDEMCVRFNLYHDFKIAFFSPENAPIAYHAVKLLEKLCGKRLQSGTESNCATLEQYKAAKKYYEDNFFHVLPDDGYTVDNILAKAKYLIRKKGVKIFVIDPFNRLENEQDGKESETQYISRVLDKLTNFAQQTDTLVFLMAHPTKIRKDINGGIPTLYDINGSANFFNKTDFGIIVHRNRDEGYTLVRVEKVKFRHLGEPGETTFKFNPINGRYIEWDKESGDTVDFDEHTEDFVTMKTKGELVLPEVEEPLPWEVKPQDATELDPPIQDATYDQLTSRNPNYGFLNAGRASPSQNNDFIPFRDDNEELPF